jgi:enoyl-CoA hydratase/carnithine racemase
MMQDLRGLWQNVYVDSAALRCVILTGKGDKAFSAGADLKERNTIDVETWQKQHAVLEQAIEAMLDCPIPIVAAVNGAAFGGGLELLLACDFSYASDTATFAFPEPKIGIIPGAMGTQQLPRACGLRRAKELCFTGDVFSAAQAYEWGLVNKVCATASLMDDVLAVARRLAQNAPLAIHQVKKALDASSRMGLRSGYRYELEAYNRLIPTEDRKEGILAFNEKRAPVFTGR